MILEDNIQIDKLIKDLEQLIVSKRDIIHEIPKLKIEVEEVMSSILLWMEEYWILNKEPNKEIENQIFNDILDLKNILHKL